MGNKAMKLTVARIIGDSKAPANPVQENRTSVYYTRPTPQIFQAMPALISASSAYGFTEHPALFEPLYEVNDPDQYLGRSVAVCTHVRAVNSWFLEAIGNSDFC